MKKFYPTLLLLLFICLSCPSFAGEEVSTGDLLFFKNHLSITSGLNVPMLNNAVSGGKSFRVIGLPGASLGFRFTGNVHRNFGIITGFNAGFQTIQFDFSTDHLQSNYSWAEPYMAVPLLINPRILVKGRHVLGLEAGASLHCFVPNNYKAQYFNKSNNNRNESVEMDIKTVKTNPYIQPEFAVTYGLVLKNLNILSLDIRYSLGTKSLIDGKYTWREIDQVKEQGTIHTPDSFLSIGMTYSFTRAAHLRQKMHDYKLEPLKED